MIEQTENDIQVKSVGGVVMANFVEFLGSGIMVEGDKVTLAFSTDKISLDVTMTKEEARAMAGKLSKAAK